MAGTASEEKAFRRFLEIFLREMRGALGEDEPLPLRPLPDLVSEDECVEGLSVLCVEGLSVLCVEGLSVLCVEGLSVLRVEGLTVLCVAPCTELESVKLAQLVFNKLYETCCMWLKDFPRRRRPLPYYETSIHAIKNMRRKMEDKHIVIPDFNTLFNLQDQEEQAYFAVFDGHGGVDAAIYASNHLHVNLVRQEMFHQDPAEALCRAFKLTDEKFVQKAARENLRCGTTGVVTFLRGNMLHVAWLGDSQVMLVKRGQVVELMKPHKPDREDEKKRIEALGGCVIWFGAWRVNGSLSVSRAIGDPVHKPYISGDADCTSLQLDGTEDYLLLACDGFFDTVSPEEAVHIVSDHLLENSGDSSMVAHKLVASARDAGSSDNISVIVVFLRDPDAPPPEEEEEEPAQGTDSFEGGGEQDSQNQGAESGGKAGPLHQCSAPADLGYEDRMDSLTDRTSLSLGPELALLQDKDRLQLPAAGVGNPSRSAPSAPALLPTSGPGAARRPPREEGLSAYGLRDSLWAPKPRLPSSSSYQRPTPAGHWFETATLLSQERRSLTQPPFSFQRRLRRCCRQGKKVPPSLPWRRAPRHSPKPWSCLERPSIAILNPHKCCNI
ncbi:UNVERIFIED_CONTAM: hypothetical protein FKN15_051719 [Acipenser sinensis]